MKPQAFFVAEFPCDRHCRVELDMAEHHEQVTHRQLLAAADLEHDRIHAAPRPFVPSFREPTFRTPSL